VNKIEFEIKTEFRKESGNLDPVPKESIILSNNILKFVQKTNFEKLKTNF